METKRKVTYFGGVLQNKDKPICVSHHHPHFAGYLPPDAPSPASAPAEVGQWLDGRGGGVSR